MCISKEKLDDMIRKLDKFSDTITIQITSNTQTIVGTKKDILYRIKAGYFKITNDINITELKPTDRWYGSYFCISNIKIRSNKK